MGKYTLMDRVWPGVAVEENNLQVQISALRKVLGDDRDMIRTIPGRGYRFAGQVNLKSDVRSDLAGSAQSFGSSEERHRLLIVVLPFLNLSGDPEYDYFVDGLTGGLTTDLSRALPGSFVISRSTAFVYKGRSVFCSTGWKRWSRLIWALKTRATMLRVRGAFRKVIAANHAIIAQDRGEPTAYREIGLNQLYLGAFEAAVVSFQRADRIAPLDPIR